MEITPIYAALNHIIKRNNLVRTEFVLSGLSKRQITEVFNFHNHYGRCLVHYATSVQMYELLARFGVDFTPTDKNESTCVHIACMYDAPRKLKYLLRHTPLPLNVANINGDTPLMIAIGRGHVRICKILHDHGCAVNMDFRFLDVSLLIIAVFYETMCVQNARPNANVRVARHHDVVKWVLSFPHSNNDLFCNGRDGINALHLACNPPTKRLLGSLMLGEILLVLRSTLFCPRLSRSKKLGKLPPDLLKLVGKVLIR